MKRTIDAERLKAGIFNACIDEHFKPTKLLGWDRITDIINNAPTVDDERIVKTLETIQTVIDDTNGNTDNVSKAIRNTAKFIKNAINGEMPDYENVEGEDCGERPTGEWLDMPFGHHCSNCHKGTVFINRVYDFCPNCGAKMKGEKE